MKPIAISAQVSLYPLRQPELGPGIAKVSTVLEASGLIVERGPMSTLVVGDADAVFDALRDSFAAAASLGDTVMVFSCSNCCPTHSLAPRTGQP